MRRASLSEISAPASPTGASAAAKAAAAFPPSQEVSRGDGGSSSCAGSGLRVTGLRAKLRDRRVRNEVECAVVCARRLCLPEDVWGHAGADDRRAIALALADGPRAVREEAVAERAGPWLHEEAVLAL